MSQLLRYLSAGRRVLLVSPPGMGKTARIAADAAQLGRRLVVMRASLSERIDFGGCLIPDHAAGITRALPLEVLADLRTTKEPTVLFLDDLGQAPMDVQAAAMRLFDAGELSDSVLICGATNRPGDKAGVTALCEPLRSRFDLAFSLPTPTSSDSPDGGVMLGTWADEVAGWVEWAAAAGACPEIIAWHRATSGRTLHTWKPCADPSIRMADFRSWAVVVKLWNDGLRDLHSIAAAIGKPAAAEFLAFANLAANLPTPDQVWMDPKGAPVPTEPNALYLIAAMLAAAVEPKHAPAMVTYLSRMPRVYGALLGRDAYRKLGAKLGGVPAWVAWFRDNQQLFTGA